MCIDLPGDVSMSLLQPYFKKGYNVTLEDDISSLKLAEELKQKKNS